jgi:predicted dehydrogenase
MTPSSIRFGIIGAGRIAEGFAAAIKATEGELTAVASRSLANAQAFQSRFNLKKAYGSYQALLADEDIDCVYVATPHSLHAEHMKMALKANKHVLCEKAFTLNAREAIEVFALAKSKGLFVMEAMWTRFLPTIQEVMKRVKIGLIGDVTRMEVTLAFQQRFDPESRLFNPTLGGGVLLDLGVYTVTMANLIMGKPTHFLVNTKKYPNGVDEETKMIANYPAGKANLVVSFAQSLPSQAIITGTKGMIHIEHFHRSEKATVTKFDGNLFEAISFPHPINGMEFEIREVIQCIKSGKTESLIMTWQDTIAIMEQLDVIRHLSGLVYPLEFER